jgi:hypothetical protein
VAVIVELVAVELVAVPSCSVVGEQPASTYAALRRVVAKQI